MQKILQKVPSELVDSNKNRRWILHIVENGEANAFALPNGQIFLFTGILKVALSSPNTNIDDALAAVLSHEIAHVLARHPSENLSIGQLLSVALFMAKTVLTFGTGFDFYSPLPDIISNFLFTLPFSRKCESEADYIGLHLMARSGFNPMEALNFWMCMKNNNTSSLENKLSFLSTHPATESRIQQIRKWMPSALLVYNENSFE